MPYGFEGEDKYLGLLHKLDSSYKGTYMWANMEVAAIINVKKHVETFIFWGEGS